MLISTGMLCFATPMPGKGLIDGKQYYIYGGTDLDHIFMHTEDSTVTNMGDVCLTERYVSAEPSPWDDSRYIWTLERQSDGTYMIEIFNEKYLRIRQDGSVVIYHNIGSNEYKFDICREDNGLYTIKNGDKYLSRDSITGTSFTLLTTPTDCSYWTFMAAEKGYANYYGYKYGDLDTATLADELYEKTITECFYGMDYYESMSTSLVASDEVLEQLLVSDITIFATKGDAGYVITDPTGGPDSMIMADYELTQGYTQQYISMLGANYLARSRCIIYASSDSGNVALDNDGYGYNLVDITYDKGAHFVLGFTCEMPSNLINQWVLHFLYYAVEHRCSIISSVFLACWLTDLYKTENGVDDYFAYVYFRGDGNQFLDF